MQPTSHPSAQVLIQKISFLIITESNRGPLHIPLFFFTLQFIVLIALLHLIFTALNKSKRATFFPTIKSGPYATIKSTQYAAIDATLI
jgi:hypothetical protein